MVFRSLDSGWENHIKFTKNKNINITPHFVVMYKIFKSERRNENCRLYERKNGVGENEKIRWYKGIPCCA
jgi:hypothetical protein